MICHLSDAFRVAIGEKSARFTSNLISQTVIKWIALRAPLQWPKGIQTPPEVNQNGETCTRPMDFEQDRTHLIALIERFTATQKIFTFSRIPFLDACPNKNGSAGGTWTLIITCGSLVREPGRAGSPRPEAWLPCPPHEQEL